MKLTYCYTQLLAWAESGRAPDPAVDAAARAAGIDDLGRRAFLAGKDGLGEVVAELTPAAVDEPGFDRVVARSLAIVIVIWQRCLPDPAGGPMTAFAKATHTEMCDYAERLGRFDEMPPAVLERLHAIVPPPTAADLFTEALDEIPEELSEAPREDDESRQDVQPIGPLRPPGRYEYALRSVHPAMWGGLILAAVVAAASC